MRIRILRWTIVLVLCGCGESLESREQWTPAEAEEWYGRQPWLVGVNFVPSTAVNQLEMWQAETFDEETIDRELGWAAALGFNTIRVFLHDLLWADDPEGFLQRIDRFLALADGHGLATMLVIFDGVWDPLPALGPQPDPVPYIHNSRWVQSPGAEYLGRPERLDELRGYVEGVIGRFRADRRVVIWDLFNEGDNQNPAYGAVELSRADKRAGAIALAERVFEWARAARPTQPLTAGVFLLDVDDPARLSPFNEVLLRESDIVTFHTYDPPEDVRTLVTFLRRYDRPIVCTEYMARPVSTFEEILPIFQEERIGAYSWGLVSGRTQTIYSWLSWVVVDPGPEQAEPWFHDILHGDGTPYDEAEAALIRARTGG